MKADEQGCVIVHVWHCQITGQKMNFPPHLCDWPVFFATLSLCLKATMSGPHHCHKSNMQNDDKRALKAFSDKNAILVVAF